MTEPGTAEWTDMECPKCGGSFVARDKFGLFCCVSECGFSIKDLYIDPPYRGGEMISGIGEKTIATIKQQLCDLVDSHKRNLQKAFSGSEEGEIKVSFGVDIRQAADNLSIETKISYVVEKVTDKQAGFINENQPMLFPVKDERLVVNE